MAPFNNKPLVSVICITYNHEKFLNDCLDSLVCQKTNFPFEIIVHDDKSTDATIEIIKQYQSKYPNLIRPIFEETNQYSLGKSIIEDCALPFAQGKYVAICEGDDRWCDENKLQRQFDFMENNPEYVACFHNSIMHDLSGKTKDREFNNFKDITDVSPEMLIKFGSFHTSSYFVRKDCYKKLDFGKSCWMGDYVVATSLLTRGKLAILPYIMSVYNWNNPTGVMKKNVGKNFESIIKSSIVEKDYLEKYDEFTGHKYSNYIKERLARIEVFAFDDYRLINSKDNKEFRKIQKEIRTSDNYLIIKRSSSLFRRIKLFIKYHLPRKVFISIKNKG